MRKFQKLDGIAWEVIELTQKREVASVSRNGGEKWLRDMEKEAKERMERNKKEKKKPKAPDEKFIKQLERDNRGNNGDR